VLAAGIAIGLVLASCGGDDDDLSPSDRHYYESQIEFGLTYRDLETNVQRGICRMTDRERVAFLADADLKLGDGSPIDRDAALDYLNDVCDG
jgi:hypothetical protein